MSKFKVGDVVRRINFNNTGLKVGHLYTIAEDPTLSSVHIRGHGGGFDACNFELVRRAGESKPHPHAELMAQYAQDAKETDKPWERWERFSEMFCKWVPLKEPTSFDTDVKYRRKPQTININGYEVPEPAGNTLPSGYAYWIVTPSLEIPVIREVWDNELEIHSIRLKRGLVHTTREAAELHAKALLSFTNGKG